MDEWLYAPDAIIRNASLPSKASLHSLLSVSLRVWILSPSCLFRLVHVRKLLLKEKNHSCAAFFRRYCHIIVDAKTSLYCCKCLTLVANTADENNSNLLLRNHFQLDNFSCKELTAVAKNSRFLQGTHCCCEEITVVDKKSKLLTDMALQ